MGVQYKSYKGQVKNDVNRRSKNVLTALGIFLKGAMKLLVPVDTSRLKNSLDFDVLVNTLRFGASAGANGSKNKDVKYAIYQELGTRYMKAQPYIRPAVFDNTSQIQRLAQKTFTEG